MRPQLKAQDESDMVAARAAFLRMQKEEDIAMQQTSNPEEIKKINGDYKKKYDSLAAGNDPQFNRPYFRNESGSNQFKELFSDNFHLRRDLSAKDQAFKLDRRNTHAGFINGIQAVRESNYYDRPIAAAETAEYIDKLQQHGFLTESEAAQKKQDSLHDLDLERAGRKLSEISAEPVADFNGTGVMNPVNMQVTQYKEYVNSLGNISDEQKKNFTKKADSIYSNAQKATKAAEKEQQVLKEKQQFAYENDYMQEVIEGKQTFSSIFSNPNISEKFKRGKLTEYAKKVDTWNKVIQKENKTMKEQTKANELQLQNNMVNSGITNTALNFDKALDDAQGTKQAAVLNSIYTAVGMDSQMKTYLANVDKGSESMQPHVKASRDAHLKDMNRIFGLTKESFDIYKDVDLAGWGTGDKATIDKKTGVKKVDGLAEYDRMKAVNSALIKYDSFMKAGKEKEAEDFMSDFKITYETSQNDTKLYDKFFSKTVRYK